jgi:hypothetical protein
LAFEPLSGGKDQLGHLELLPPRFGEVAAAEVA